ncbi:heptaprenyl diphosphate synthase component 1 [Fictibacillus sp. 5RED26]|uniref:heptaprenyl diphosphate synthase component 1 n=1 Tax=Fictibacillus sp. 5RED26 TaxID=2745876 RepID=UPI0018CDF2AB|nr:heptaprenyl diphosphate synthase component 1 [Fictibacillus sp. 5RED26]MBH0157465.1 heptaprenyl diphosphate synthase component 1 [Fictibacillus sp. 5RED26]
MNTMEQIQRLKQHTLLLMQHGYVDRFLQPPVFNESKVFITYCLLRELELDEAVEAEYFSSITLMQAALDRHDDILEENITENKKKRQLVVLSGDYFSSLYYLLLSHCENLDLIQKLSSAVQEINEQKADLHIQSRDKFSITSVEYLKAVQKIDSLLFTKAAESFGLHTYIPFIERYLLVSRYQNMDTRRRLSEEQLNFLKTCETEIKNKAVEMPLLFHREGYSMEDASKNDLMLGEG